MSLKRPDGPEALVAPMYFVAFLLTATPVMDFVTSVLPMRTADIEWRFASVGLLSGFLLTPLLGVGLAVAVAQFAGHERFQRVVSLVNLSLTVVFVALLVAFLLDVLQLRSAVQAEAQEAFMSAAVKAVIKHVCFVVALGFLGWRGFRMSRWTLPEARRQQASVVVGG